MYCLKFKIFLSLLVLMTISPHVHCQQFAYSTGFMSSEYAPLDNNPDSDYVMESNLLTLWETETYHVPVPTKPGSREEQATHISMNCNPEGDFPIDMLFSPDGKEVVVLHRDTANLVFFDPTNAQPQHVVDVENHPVDMAITNDGRYILVVHVFDQNITIVDRLSHQVHCVIDVSGWQPFSVEISGDDSTAIVGAVGDPVPVFCVIDLKKMVEIRTIPCTPHGAIGGAYSPVTDKFSYIYSKLL